MDFFILYIFVSSYFFDGKHSFSLFAQLDCARCSGSTETTPSDANYDAIPRDTKPRDATADDASLPHAKPDGAKPSDATPSETKTATNYKKPRGIELSDLTPHDAVPSHATSPRITPGNVTSAAMPHSTNPCNV